MFHTSIRPLVFEVQFTTFRHAAAANQIKTKARELVSTQENAPILSQTPVRVLRRVLRPAVRSIPVPVGRGYFVHIASH